MISVKSTSIVGLFVVLAAIAAPPKLRAGTKIGLLIAQHGQPYHVYNAVMRLPALTKTNTNLLTERDANLAAFGSLEDWHQAHVHEWFALLKDSEGTMNLQQLLQVVMGQTLLGEFSSLGEEDFKAAIGAAERSLDDDGINDDDLTPIFNWLDKNGDGYLSLQERSGAMSEDCTGQASDEILCNLYVTLIEALMPSSQLNYDMWKEELISEGASVHDEVSRQSSWF